MIAEPKRKKGLLFFPDKNSANERLSQLSHCKAIDYSLNIALLTYISSYIKEISTLLFFGNSPWLQTLIFKSLLILNKSVFFLKKINDSLFVFPHDSVSKEYACIAGDFSSIPGLRRAPGEGTSNPLQYSCLENSMD